MKEMTDTYQLKAFLVTVFSLNFHSALSIGKLVDNAQWER